jgi:thioredoxin-related protein
MFAMLLASTLLAVTAARANPHGLVMSEDLRGESAQAQQAGKPLVLMFSLPECAYCMVVRRNYLLPMIREAGNDPPQIRELTMTGRQAIKDFDGSVTTPTAIAKRYGVKVAPTLVFVNAAGEVLSEPIVGGDHQFFSVYLERAFETAGARLNDKRVRPR